MRFRQRGQTVIVLGLLLLGLATAIAVLQTESDVVSAAELQQGSNNVTTFPWADPATVALVDPAGPQGASDDQGATGTHIDFTALAYAAAYDQCAASALAEVRAS